LSSQRKSAGENNVALKYNSKDIYHDTVKNALVKDGWNITYDPLALKWGSQQGSLH
jgi:hypothetical protein